MSQIQGYISAAGPGGPILSLTGDAGGMVGPDGGGNINILGVEGADLYAFAVVDGDPGANTLNITPHFETVTTNDAVATNFPDASVTLDASTAYVMSAHVIGARDDYTAACGGIVTGVVRRGAAGAAVFVGDNAFSSEDSAVGTPQFGVAANGNDITVFAQGVAGQTWNWTCTFTYIIQLA